MGFGFNIFMVVFFLPVALILVLLWLYTYKKIFGKILGIISLLLVGFVILAIIIGRYNSIPTLDRDDYYGKYVIDRDFYPGIQADWQYEHFRFEITDDDSIFFYITDKDQILHVYKGSIATTEAYVSERLIINMEQPTHHILATNPTTYRVVRGYYLVFDSPEFKNVFFKQGDWKPLEE